jgi:hypothetical protein
MRPLSWHDDEVTSQTMIVGIGALIILVACDDLTANSGDNQYCRSTYSIDQFCTNILHDAPLSQHPGAKDDGGFQ